MGIVVLWFFGHTTIHERLQISPDPKGSTSVQLLHGRTPLGVGGNLKELLGSTDYLFCFL